MRQDAYLLEKATEDKTVLVLAVPENLLVELGLEEISKEQET